MRLISKNLGKKVERAILKISQKQIFKFLETLILRSLLI